MSLVFEVLRSRDVHLPRDFADRLSRTIPLVKEGAKTILELADLVVLIKAFTHYFGMANLAEKLHAHGQSAPDVMRHTLRQLRERGVAKQPVEEGRLARAQNTRDVVQRDLGPTGISLPTNTGAPDGLPSGDPPWGSTVTA